MKINPKATKAELVKMLMDKHDESVGWHQAAKKAEDALAARIDRMGDNKPWRLVAITAAIAFAGGLLVGWVL